MCAMCIPAMFKTLSTLIVSTNILVIEYNIKYEQNIIPFFLSVPSFFNMKNITTNTIAFNIDSYKNVGWKYS